MSSYEKYSAIRDSKGLTDYKVSKETGIGTATFSNWKNGKYQPKQDKIKKIADFLGVNPSDISDASGKTVIRVHRIVNTKPTNGNDLEFQGSIKSKIDELTKAIMSQAIGTLCDDDLFWLAKLFTKLNEEGKNKLYDYMEDLLLIGKYTESGSPYIVNWDSDESEPNESNIESAEADYEKVFGIQSEQESRALNITEENTIEEKAN